MKFRDYSQTKRAEMQLAPMIDVVFLLLIFFIVSWNFARFETEQSIEVPTADSAEQNPRKPGEIIINVRDDGTMVVNGVVETEDSLRERLQRISARYPDQPIILRGDKRSKYSHVMKVLELCQEANIWNVAFAAVKPQAAPPGPGFEP